MTNFNTILTAQYLNNLNLERIKQELFDLILDLPDNPKINRISDRCFTISTKDLSNDLCLTPEYYDFKKQYQLIVQIIEESTVKRTKALMDEIIRKGSIRYTSNIHHRFHPDVVEHLKVLME